MTRKDSEVLAKAFNRRQPNVEWLNKRIQWMFDVIAVAEVCYKGNPRFSYVKFTNACGFTESDHGHFDYSEIFA